jgi:hypothetical protein
MTEKPNLEGRTARCSYFGGNANRKPYSGCDPCAATGRCNCTAPSSESLAFFRYHGADTPEGAAQQPQNRRFESGRFDEFYCGCHGWD